MKVAKFGGSSVAGPDQFRQVKSILQSDPGIAAAVISACGKRSSDDHKMTDLLYLIHAHLTYGVPCSNIVSSIRERFSEISGTLGIGNDVMNEFDAYFASVSGETSRDELVSRGEYFTSRLMAEYLGFRFIDAKDCIFFGFDGHLDVEKTYLTLKMLLSDGVRAVIPGFYGALPSGRIKVMSRGGSDITGAIVAAAINAEVYQNWTDVSGILMADPKIVKEPAPIRKLTYAELREMAFLGASVLHEESILPVRELDIPLNIRNTFLPSDPGTLILEKIDESEDGTDRFLTGIAGRKNFSAITVFKHNMGSTEPMRKALEILDNANASVEHITLGLDAFSVISSTASLGEGVYEIISEIKKAVHPEDVRLEEGIALVAAVGRKMTFRPGISGKLFKALGDNGINVRTIAQGSDELAIIVGVNNEDYDKTINVLYDSFAS